MTIQVKASKSFLRKDPEKKVPDGTMITDKLTENAALFPNLPYKIPDLSDVNKRLNDATVTAKSGDKIAGAELKTVNAEWIAMFGQTADAVSLVANGDTKIILKAGMTPTSSESRKRQKPERANIEAKPGKGTCAITADAQKDVNGYVALVADELVTMTLNGDVVEMDANGLKIFMKVSTRRLMQLDGLPSVKQFCVTMLTFNSAGSSPLSNSEEIVTQ